MRETVRKRMYHRAQRVFRFPESEPFRPELLRREIFPWLHNTGGRSIQPKRIRTVLVADSDYSRRDILTRVFAGDGHKVIEAADGHKAAGFICRGGIDLLACCVILNGMDGLELLRALRDMKVRIPAVALAPGNTQMDQIYLRSATLLGAFRTYLPPVNSDILLDDARALLALSID